MQNVKTQTKVYNVPLEKVLMKSLAPHCFSFNLFISSKHVLLKSSAGNTIIVEKHNLYVAIIAAGAVESFTNPSKLMLIIMYSSF